MALDTLHGLFIHGVGQQGPSFAHDSRRYLRAAMLKQGVSSYMRSVWWAPYADKYEHEFLKKVEKKGSRANLTQKLVVGTLADALFYQGSPKLQQECFSLLDYEYDQLGNQKHNAVIFAHSLGGLIATDWLRARPQNGIRKLITFGCNLGIFNLDGNFDNPRQLVYGKWTNMFDSSDMLGYPLAVQPSFAHVQDVEVSVGGWLTGWWGISHCSYFGDKKLWSKTIPDHLKVRF